jgi:hypothetical protein
LILALDVRRNPYWVARVYATVSDVGDTHDWNAVDYVLTWLNDTVRNASFGINELPQRDHGNRINTHRNASLGYTGALDADAPAAPYRSRAAPTRKKSAISRARAPTDRHSKYNLPYT